MKHIHAIFLFTATLVLASAGCSRPCPSGFGGMKWERTGTPADSLTILLERQFYEAKDHDTIMESIGRLRAFARHWSRDAISIPPDSLSARCAPTPP